MKMIADRGRLASLALAVGLMACAPASPPGASGGPESLAGTSWELTELNGRGPVTTGTTPTLQFATDEPRASGNGGCNLFNGPYTQSGDSLRFGALVSTRRACADQAANSQEIAFLRALESTTRFSTGDGMLVLYGGDQVVARFRSSAG